MSTIITRLYVDNRRATDAQTALAGHGFGADAVRLIARAALPPEADAASRKAADVLASLGVRASAAAAYAKEAVRTGGTLLVVEAAFGRASNALFELDRFGPADVPVADTYLGSYDGAWLSDAFGLPTLSSNAAPLSRLFGLPLLTRGESTTRLSNKAAPFSGSVGLPLLTSGQSNTKLANKPGPYSGTFGLPLLSSNPAPLSSLFGLPTLTRSKGSDY